MKEEDNDDDANHGNPENYTVRLCDWIRSLSLHEVPLEVQVRAKHLILDGVACALAGARLPWSLTACETVLTIESPGPCAIIGHEKSVGPLAAALLNSAFIQGFELDDYHDLAPLHSNAILFPALLAAVQHRNQHQHRHQGTLPADSKINGASFLLAMIVGYEVGPRTGLALGGGHILSQGWHSGAVFGPSASAAAVSKLLGLPSDQIEDALGTACTQACGLMSAQFESMVKRMQHGFASRNGLFAALMAAGGYTGIKQVYERSYGGFLTTFTQGSQKEPPFHIDKLTNGLGETWETKNIKIKPYAAMAGTFGTIDCIAALQQQQLLPQNLSEIRKIRVEMGDVAFKHGGWTPTPPIEATGAQMSAAYIAAVQLVHGEVTPAQFRLDDLDREDRWDLVRKVACEHNADYDTAEPWKQKVTVSLADGCDVVHEERAPAGVRSPLSNEEIVRKWRRIARDVVDEERSWEIERLVLRLEDLADVEGLVGLLAPATRSPIS